MQYRGRAVHCVNELEMGKRALFFCRLYYSSFKLTAKLSREVSYCPTHADLPPPPTPCTRVVQLLHLMNLHQYIQITQNLQFTSGFTRNVVHFMDFDKYIHYNSIIQSTSTALKILCALCLFASPVYPWQPLIFLLFSLFCLFLSVIQLESKACSLFRLTSFT